MFFFFTKTHTGTLSETLFFKCSGAADSITHKMLCDTCVCGCVCVSRGLFNKAGSTLYVYPNPTHPAQKISGVQKCSAQPCRSGDRSISTCLSPHLSAATGTVVSIICFSVATPLSEPQEHYIDTQVTPIPTQIDPS